MAQRGTAGTPAAPGETRRAWVQASRLPTLPAAVVPVLVGTAVAAHRPIHWPVFFATIAAALLIQIGANFANDLFDFQHGTDTDERMGPQRGLQRGVITSRQMQGATALVFGASMLIGLYLVFVGGLPILVAGLLSILAALAYTGGPYPLGYHGLGDLFVFIFFGVVAVGGTYYLQTGGLNWVAIVVSIPVGLLCTAILVVNNVRDVDTDRTAGKRTLVVLLGPNGGRMEYVLLLVISYLVPAFLALSGAVGFWFWLPWLSLPLAVRLVRRLYRLHGKPLNAVLKQTGQLHLLYGVLFALSLVT